MLTASVVALMLAGTPAAAPLALPLTSPIVATDPEALLIRLIRFYRAERRQTRIVGVLQVPPALLRSALAGASGYNVAVRVVDSSGLTLYTESWDRRAPNGRRDDAAGVELLRFATAPGSYRLEVVVHDPDAMQRVTLTTDLRAFADDPGASDLLLSPRMRVVAEDPAALRTDELQHGSSVVAMAPVLRLTSHRTEAFFLMEAYGEARRETTARMAVAVIDSLGRTLVRTPERTVRIGAGGAVLRGQLDLEGLPPGRYTMKLLLDGEGGAIERSAEFLMDGVQEERMEPEGGDPLALRAGDRQILAGTR